MKTISDGRGGSYSGARAAQVLLDPMARPAGPLDALPAVALRTAALSAPSHFELLPKKLELPAVP